MELINIAKRVQQNSSAHQMDLVCRLRDIAEASDNFGIQAMARPVVKHYLAFPRWLGAEWFG
jgi:hypothetical protein